MSPTPGHPDAVAAGCRCPIIDNGRGLCPRPGGFIVNLDCPMHGPGWIAEHEGALMTETDGSHGDDLTTCDVATAAARRDEAKRRLLRTRPSVEG